LNFSWKMEVAMGEVARVGAGVAMGVLVVEGEGEAGTVSVAAAAAAVAKGSKGRGEETTREGAAAGIAKGSAEKGEAVPAEGVDRVDLAKENGSGKGNGEEAAGREGLMAEEAERDTGEANMSAGLGVAGEDGGEEGVEVELEVKEVKLELELEAEAA
jgi:hypothetical protein